MTLFIGIWKRKEIEYYSDEELEHIFEMIMSIHQ